MEGDEWWLWWAWWTDNPELSGWMFSDRLPCQMWGECRHRKDSDLLTWNGCFHHIMSIKWKTKLSAEDLAFSNVYTQITATITTYLYAFYVWHYSQCFPHLLIKSSQQLFEVSTVFHNLHWDNWGTGRISNQPKVTQLVSGRAGFLNPDTLSPGFNPCALSPQPRRTCSSLIHSFD